MVDIRLVAPYEVEGVKKASLDEAIKYLKRQSIIGFDIETTEQPIDGSSALDPHTNKIVTIQLGTSRIVYVFDMRFVSISKLKYIIESKKITKCGANLKFDTKNVIKYGIFPKSLHDTMLWEQIMHNGIKQVKGFYSLAEISKRWNIFDYDNNDIGISKDVRTTFSDVGPLTKTQVLYAGFDVYTAVKVAKKQMKYTKNMLIQKCIDLENNFVVPLAWAEYSGMNINPMKWLDNLETYKVQLEVQQQKLDAFAIEQGMPGINWNSPKQVIPLFKELGVPVSIVDKEKSADSGEEVIKETVGKTHIQKYSGSHPIVEEYLEFKQLKRLTTAYGVKFLENINPVSGRIHSEYFQILHTGRISSSSPK